MTINTDILKNTAGLVMWLDGEINSRAGVRDTSINGMQNLVYTPFAGKSSTAGFCEKFNGTATFSDKGVKLGGTCHYPAYYIADDVTVEFVLDFGQCAVEANRVHVIMDNRYNSYGFQILARDFSDSDSMRVTFDAGNGSTSRTKYVDVYSTGKRVYCAMTSKLTEANSTKIYLDGELAEFSGPDAVAAPRTTFNSMSLSIGGGSSSTLSSAKPTSSNQWGSGAFYAPNDIFYAFRLWSRQLSEKEVLDNYKRDFERFGA